MEPEYQIGIGSAANEAQGMNPSPECSQERCRELELLRVQMQDEIDALRGALRQLNDERCALLASQVHLIRELIHDLLAQQRADVPSFSRPTLLAWIVRRVRQFTGRNRGNAAAVDQTEQMLTQIRNTSEELLRMAQALVAGFSAP